MTRFRAVVGSQLSRWAPYFLAAVFALLLPWRAVQPAEATLTYYDDTSGSLAYSGAWNHSAGWQWAYNNTESWTNSTGSSVSLAFNGSTITRVYAMAYNRGSQNVYIDGHLQGQFNDYASTIRWQAAKTWSVSSGSHTIMVSGAGGGGGSMDADAFVVDIPTVAAGQYDDTNSQLKYIGTWNHSPGWSGAHNGTLSWSANTQDAVTFTFTGNNVTYYYTKTYNRGKAAITIDGVDYGFLDLYSPTTLWQQSTGFGNLGAGVHTLHISVSGQKNPSSTGYNVDVDELAVDTHYHVQAFKNGTFSGVEATIETADPVIRENYFSYASINIIDSSLLNWVETGWIKDQATGCAPQFSWAIQPGSANLLTGARPTVGVAYNYYLYRVADHLWNLQILTTGGTVLQNVSIPNANMANTGTYIQAVGEVDSASGLNDLGVSGLLSLHWYDMNSWQSWNGWSYGLLDSPYSLVSIPPDTSNNVQVYGNNGNPVPPGAPCP